jgi:ESX secretion-associated protein EspG
VTPDWTRATVFSAAAFETCWEILGLGETPWQLDPPRHGDCRRAFVADVLARLQATGPALTAALRLLACPDWSVDVRIRAGSSLVAGLAAGRGACGALAVRHDRAIAVLDIEPTDAMDAVLGLLGPVRPGPGRPVMVRTTDPTPAAVAACRDVHLFGQLGASATTRDGHRTRRAPGVIGFHRTGRGDYRSIRVDRQTVALEPATHARLATDLGALLTVVR